MPFDCFMKIKDIDGESTDKQHTKWIELQSYSFGASQAVGGASVSTGGARSGQRVDLQDMNITKALDKASPKIFAACCKGTHIPEITIELCRATGDKQKYMEYKLEDVLVTSYQPSGHSMGEIPNESVTFNPAVITLTYTETDHETGKAKGNVTANWDQAQNTGA